MRCMFLTLVSMIGLAGCATQPSLQSRMAAYIGDSPQALVQSLGVPDKQITVNGVQYFAYVRHREEIEPNDLAFGGPFGPFYGPYYGGGFYNVAFPQQVQEYSCETTFLLKDERVFNFTLRGNDCD